MLLFWKRAYYAGTIHSLRLRDSRLLFIFIIYNYTNPNPDTASPNPAMISQAFIILCNFSPPL